MQKAETTPGKLDALCEYATEDARKAGIDLPLEASIDGYAGCLDRAGQILFGAGDPNLDNQKRNVLIKLFILHDLDEAFSFGLQTCLHDDSRWQTRPAWLEEWQEILGRHDSKELTDILLSSDQNRVRQRSSAPFAGLLDFNEVLQVKRKGLYAAV